MDSSLLVYDMERFLDKYTRFMTKNVYISFGMYQRFLEQYDYLYQELLKFSLLLRENLKYQKVMKIFEQRQGLVRLHNQKYLKRVCLLEQDFFDDLYSKEKLDLQKRLVILSNEERMLFINDKNTIPLVVGKLKYLKERLGYKEEKLLVLVGKDIYLEELKKEFLDYDLCNVRVDTVYGYGKSILKEEEQLISNKDRYQFIVHYITEELFVDKERFQKFYQAFSKKIYLNKDYLEYDTFRDYHNYMYKRMFLRSGLSVKKYNEQEIKKRRSYLRTIYNETMMTNEEVDIANFLTLNGISYSYDKGMFLIENNGKIYAISYIKTGEQFLKTQVDSKLFDEIILLEECKLKKREYLEVLVYELIKRRYPLERISEEDIYNLLKDTTFDGYFSEFITNTLVPAFLYYKEKNDFSNTKFNDMQIEVILGIYEDYLKYLENNHLLEWEDFLVRISKSLLPKRDHYVITVEVDGLDIETRNLMITSQYPEVELLKENIKLLYDYKKFLHDNKCFSTLHTYLDWDELNKLTSQFLKANLALVNQKMVECQGEVSVYFYDDINRLLVYKNIMCLCEKIIEDRDEDKTILIGLKRRNEINSIIEVGHLMKFDRKILVNSMGRNIFYDEMFLVDKNYDMIMLPFLIADQYHDDLLKIKEEYERKVMLYVALNKCREEVCLLVPKSKKCELESFLEMVSKVNFKEVVL